MFPRMFADVRDLSESLGIPGGEVIGSGKSVTGREEVPFSLRGDGPPGASSPGASVPSGGDRALRFYAQLRHAEERLRPLRDTKYAGTYWRVRDELRKVGRELRRAEEDRERRA